ncbi:transforming acidic coiled-coil-containing protein 3-like [Dysidea avara]|uniref:transforming acidic coiled-coil-containing protein 3-like n=1 Tax=Dysidea avara TaxID=196820 RepID=UPI0033207524
MSSELVLEDRENSLHTLKSPLKPLEQSRTALSHSQIVNQSDGLPAWDHIRQLDECESWTERTQVVTKSDHNFYISCAEDFIEEMINELPPENAQHGHDEQEELLDEQFTDDDFQTTAAQLDMDYLERLNPTSSDEAVPWSRESLYVKFDPLVGSQPVKQSDEKAIQLAQLNAAYLNKSNDLLQLDTPPRNNSTTKSQRKAVHFTPVSKQRPLVQQDLLTATPDSSLVHLNDDEEVNLGSSLSRHLQSSATKKLPSETGELVKVLKYSESDVAEIIAQVKAEVEAQAAEEEAAKINTLIQDYDQQLSELKQENDHLRSENDTVQAEAMLQFADKTAWDDEVEKWKELSKKSQDDNTIMLNKYEEMKSFVKDTEKQRDQALLDFESLEKSFNEMHQRYLKLKNVTQAMKKNETTYKEAIAELEQKLRSSHEELEQLKNEVDSKMSEANKTFHQLRKEHTSENAILKANCKKLTLQKDSLERALQQKEQEKMELTTICEELMKELGDKR